MSTGRRRGPGRLVAAAAVALLLVVALAALALVPRSDDLPAAVDAVVALGGTPGRVTLAAEIAASHDARLVLAGDSIAFGREQGLACERDALCLRPEPWTTAGEARGLATLADEHGWETVVAATSDFHVNRARMLLGQCLDEVAVVGTDADPWTAAPWRSTVRELAGMVAGLTVARAC